MQAHPGAVLIGRPACRRSSCVVAAVPPLLWRLRMPLPLACGRGESLPTANGPKASNSNRTLAATPASLRSNDGTDSPPPRCVLSRLYEVRQGRHVWVTKVP